MNQKHYSHIIYTKRSKAVDLTPLLSQDLTRSRFTNGVINITAPYADCAILIRGKHGDELKNEVGVSVTLPFFNSKLVASNLRVVLVDRAKTSTRRKIHLTLIGE
ncbi:MAG: hypothetical protein QW514_06780 [Thermoprotei archaeon]